MKSEQMSRYPSVPFLHTELNFSINRVYLQNAAINHSHIRSYIQPQLNVIYAS